MIAQLERIIDLSGIDESITSEQRELPQLFNDPREARRQQGERLQSVDVAITADGCYVDDGRFQCLEGTMFPIKRFDKRNRRGFWIGTGYIVTQNI